MTPYRVYMLDRHNRICAAQDIDCADDAEAVAQAARLARGEGVEVWSEARLVGRLGPAAGATPAG
ncbi:MAG: hypothetical protein M0Z28_12715 [Rhodospirillales bacterium]|nr:hypothetical protein [Rhodospirillales bacterium]